MYVKKEKKNSLEEVRNLEACEFLRNYYGISHESIASMTHRTMTAFFPQLQRTSFAYIQKNPELVSTGQIVMVEDVNHSQAPYIKPLVDTDQDTLENCDDREKMITKIGDELVLARENNTPLLILVEGDDLLDQYLYQPHMISNHFLFLRSLEDSKVLIRNDYSVIGYTTLNHGDNHYSTMILPPLKRQAVGISRKTDVVAVLWEKDYFEMVIDGDVRTFEDIADVKKSLHILFPIQQEEEKSTPSEEIPSIDSYHLSDMSVYELEQLMKVYRASNQMAHYHTVRRELIKKTQGSKDYRVAREKQKKIFMLKEEGE